MVFIISSLMKVEGYHLDELEASQRCMCLLCKLTFSDPACMRHLRRRLRCKPYTLYPMGDLIPPLTRTSLP